MNPCPFCGSSVGVQDVMGTNDYADGEYRVVCPAPLCGAMGPDRDTPEAAQQAWDAPRKTTTVPAPPATPPAIHTYLVSGTRMSIYGVVIRETSVSYGYTDHEAITRFLEVRHREHPAVERWQRHELSAVVIV